MLTPAVVAAIEDLELAARLVVEGMRTGGHKSPLHGFTAEFSEHRPYRAGDDLKYLDWKVLARTDRLYTRQFRETTNMAVMLVLDTSASMGFGASSASGFGAGGQEPTKLRYAAVIAAALSWLIVEQGDAVGLMMSAGGQWRYLPARSGRPHLRALLAELARVEPAGVWQPERVIARGAELLSRRGVVIAISDFYDAEEETRRELRRAMRQGHDVTMLQVVTRPEMTFPYDGDLDLEDLESGDHRIVSAESVARAYRAAMGDFLERCRSSARSDGMDYALLPTDVAPAMALRQVLLRRSGHSAGQREASA